MVAKQSAIDMMVLKSFDDRYARFANKSPQREATVKAAKKFDL